MIHIIRIGGVGIGPLTAGTRSWRSVAALGVPTPSAIPEAFHRAFALWSSLPLVMVRRELRVVTGPLSPFIVVRTLR